MNDFTSKVKNKVLKAISDFNMLDECKNIVVGFSGGADSICLLHILNSLKKEFHFEVLAAHINHGIRGEEAKRDELFAKEYCEKNNIPFKLLCINCIIDAKKNGESVEEYGRKKRYEFFNSLCYDATFKIATAHNANDNAETVIFNLIRGTALKGASGIPPVRDNIIRPLIYCSRDEIEGYCNENNLSYVTDSTNLADDYTRNKIRHKILPLMDEINSNSLNSISNFSASARDSYNFISKKAEELMSLSKCDKGYNAEIILKAHKCVIDEFIVKTFKMEFFQNLDFKKISDVLDIIKNGGRIQLFNNVYAECVKGIFRYFKKYKSPDAEKILIDKYSGKYIFQNFNINLTQSTNYSKKFNKNVLDNLIDCDNIVGQLYLRGRLEGDTFRLPRRNISKSLKKLFNEYNVPVEIRNTLPILCDDLGIVWIYSVGVCERCRVNENSNNIIFIEGDYNSGERNVK